MDDVSLKQDSQNYFSWLASQYDDENVYRMCKDDYPDILAELEREPVTDVLDCGCGTGAFLALLRKAHPELNLHGIDLAEPMIEAARAHDLANVSFIVGDCEALPYANASFDVITCSHSFHHYPNPQRFFDAAFRILRPGGRLILRDNTGSFLWLLKKNLYTIPRGNRKSHMGDVKFYSHREVTAFCRAAGLHVELFEERGDHKMHCVARKPRA